MAEELSMDMSAMPEIPQETQQLQDAQQFDMQSIINDGGPGDKNKFANVESAPPRPNELTGSAFEKSIHQMHNSVNNEIQQRKLPKTLEERMNRIDGPGVRLADETIDMYRYQDGFNPEGFDPFNSENYKHWQDKETWSSALSKGMDSFSTRFGNTYVDSFASYGRMADALFSWDWEKMMPDAAEMQELNWAEYKESMKNFVFVDPSEEDDIISKRSMSEFIGNAGFALGTVGALGTELVFDAALTAITGGGGAGSFVATAAKFTGLQAIKTAAKQGIKSMGLKGMAKVGDFIQDVGTGAFKYAGESAETLSAAGKVAGKVKQAETLAGAAKIGATTFRESMNEVFNIMSFNGKAIFKSKSAGEFFKNVAKGVPLFGTGFRYGEKIVAGAKGGLSVGALTGIGLQGARRIAQELNMSSTEAGFEAVTTYGSTLDLMVKNYQERNEGENPSPEELAKMQDKAWTAAGANYGTNLALLLATNRLQFGGLFNRFGISTKWTKELLEEGAEKSFVVNKIFKGSKETAKSYVKNRFFGAYALTGKIAKDFGKKQAIYEFGKHFMKDAFKFEISEGIQENLQETSASAWMNYFANQYEGTKLTLGKAFEQGLDEQFTKQGFRTFLQGALTGSLIRPVTSIQQNSMQWMQEKAMSRQYQDNPADNPYVKMKEQVVKDVDLQNQFFSQLSNKKFADNIITFTSHVDNTLNQTEAAAKGAQYEWQNHKDNIVLAGALAANRSGTINAYKQAIRQSGLEMSDEEFEKAFNIKLADTKYNTAAEFAEDMANDVGKYSDTIDNIRKKIKKSIDPLMYEQGSKERTVAMIRHYAQEEAIKIVALNTLKGTRAAERATAIAQDIMSIPGLDTSSDYAIRVLTNPQNFQAEVGNMKAEIRLLQESMTTADPEFKKELETKLKLAQRKLDLYDKWTNFWQFEDTTEERVNSKTGKAETRASKKATKFRGVPINVVEKDENGNVTNPNATAHRLDHPEVVSAFREFINIVNAEAGIKTELSEEAVADGIDKIVDYIRLEEDSKEYIKSVDVLYNPENFESFLGKMQDGLVKAELLTLLDGINDQLRGSVTNAFFITMSNTSQQEQEETLAKLIKELETTSQKIKQSEPYRNLLTVVLNEEFGIGYSAFVNENLGKLNDILALEITQLFDNLLPSDFTEISDDVMMEFKQTGYISPIHLNKIANKIKNNEPLSKNEGEIYDLNKDEIIRIKKFQDEILGLNIETSKYISENQELIDELKQKLVDTNEYTIEQLDLMNNLQIYDIAFEKGLFKYEDLLNTSNLSKEQVTDEEYKEFEISGFVPPAVLKNIRLKQSLQFTLTPNEQSIIDNSSTVAEEETEEEETESEETSDEEEETTSEDQEEDAEDDDPESISAAIQGDDDENEIDNLPEYNQLAELQAQTNASPQVEGSAEEGFTVLVENGTALNAEPIDTQAEAESELDKWLKNSDNAAFAVEFLSDTPVKDDIMKLKEFVKKAKQSITLFNKKQTTGTPIETIRDYNTITEGKQFLNLLKRAVVEGKTVDQVRKESTKVAGGVQLDIFESTSTPGTGVAITMSALESLHAELQSMSQPSTVSPSLVTDKKAADIERRSKDGVLLELRKITSKETFENAETEGQIEQRVIFIKEHSKDEVAKKLANEWLNIKNYPDQVNAKYNELAALETQTSAEVSGKIDTFVEKGGVTEQSIFDQLDNIQPCF